MENVLVLDTVYAVSSVSLCEGFRVVSGSAAIDKGYFGGQGRVVHLDATRDLVAAEYDWIVLGGDLPEAAMLLISQIPVIMRSRVIVVSDEQPATEVLEWYSDLWVEHSCLRSELPDKLRALIAEIAAEGGTITGDVGEADNKS